MTLVLLLAAMPWPPPQMPTEDQFKQIQAFAKASRPQPSALVGPDVIDASLPRSVSEAEMKAAIESFKNAWFLGGKFFGKQQVEVDVFLLPNKESTTVKYVWTSATDAKGGSLLKTAAAPAEKLDGNGGATIVLANPDGEEEVAQARAKVTIEAPSGFDEVTLDCKEAGKAVGKATLERCTGDVFSVLVDGFEESDRVVPLNKDKLPLDTGESSRGALFSGKAMEDVSYEEFKKGPGSVWRAEGRARGTVAFVRWLRPKPAKPVAIEIVATKEPSHEDYGASSRVRFAPPVADVPAFTPITAPLSFESGRACAMFGYNQPQIHLVFPKSAVSAYARADLSPPKVKGGSKGGFELETNGMDERVYRYKWTLAGKDDKVPFSFASADVKAEVRYPSAVSVRDKDFVIQGHKVTITLGDGEEIANEITVEGKKLPGITAFDSAGRVLKQFGYTESNESGTTYAFMGPVAKARAIIVGAMVTKTVSGKLKPAPLRPKDKAGLCD